MNLDLFLILILPFFIYGFMTGAFTNSKTTLIVLIAIFSIALHTRLLIPAGESIPEPTFLLHTYIFLLFLFVRAVFREKFKNSSNIWLRRLTYA